MARTPVTGANVPVRQVPAGPTPVRQAPVGHLTGSDIGRAWFRDNEQGLLASRPREYAEDPLVLDEGGWWAVIGTFEGRMGLWRFDDVRPAPLPPPDPSWASGPPTPGTTITPTGAGLPTTTSGWRTSLSRTDYLSGVARIRARIGRGEVYQVNLCRVLRAGTGTEPWALAARLAAGNPAPHAAVLDLPGGPCPAGDGRTRVVSASPELFLARDGDRLRCSPIKGTAPVVGSMLQKDHAENVMIVDMVRNDFSRICRPDSVAVPSLLREEAHPGLVHLVSTVSGQLRQDVGWPRILAATTPVASVSGAPRSSALRAIAALEPVPRGPYCGFFGWIDADRARARLAVTIRTFWWEADTLAFGTGAGITWGSDPHREWAETELKARRLVALAAGGASDRPTHPVRTAL